MPYKKLKYRVERTEVSRFLVGVTTAPAIAQMDWY